MSMAFREWWMGVVEEIQVGCQGRQWSWRFLLWVWFVFMFVQHVRDAEYQSFLGGLNLGIHEFGHLIFGPFGKFMGVAGGSLTQCLVPLASFIMFYRQGDYFAFAFSFTWLGSNLFGVARYVADARVLQLPLVSPFGGNGEIIHDWNYLLHQMGLLSYDTTLAAALRASAFAMMAAGVLWGAGILWLMVRSRTVAKQAEATIETTDLNF
jgi:hypothetical protein